MIDRALFGLFLFAKRIARGATQRDVAKAAGVRIEAVVRAEAMAPIRWRQFSKLCHWQGERPEIFEIQGRG
jgi:transcriptional regulator with XRE-family HTH domain